MTVDDTVPTSAGLSSFNLLDEDKFFTGLALKPGMTLLDFGCGVGNNLVDACTVQRRTMKNSSGVLPTLITALFLLFPPTAWGNATAAFKVADYTYTIVASYPHDFEAFTQGLVFDQGDLFESTGINGRSSLRRVKLETGEVLQVYKVPSQFFAEGIAVFDDTIIQLTWKSNFGFVYDQNSFKLLRVFSYPFEGWGLTHDGRQLISSDGTPTIRFLDPLSFAEKRRIEVADETGPVSNLNELEYVNGRIYANVWQSDRIAIIDPENGRVTGWLDLSGLLGKEGEGRPVDVLNGIAYDPAKDSLYVTGKLWPRLYEIKPVLRHAE
jgi:glutamine cyclotransferase